MKKFLEDIKKDIKFKSAGPGKKLTEDTRYKSVFRLHVLRVYESQALGQC